MRCLSPTFNFCVCVCVFVFRIARVWATTACRSFGLAQFLLLPVCFTWKSNSRNSLPPSDAKTKPLRTRGEIRCQRVHRRASTRTGRLAGRRFHWTLRILLLPDVLCFVSSPFLSHSVSWSPTSNPLDISLSAFPGPCLRAFLGRLVSFLAPRVRRRFFNLKSRECHTQLLRSAGRRFVCEESGSFKGVS